MLSFLSCFLTACGFHLRGQGGEQTLMFEKGMQVYLAITDKDRLLQRQIRNDLQASGVLVVDKPELSQNHLVVLNSEIEKRAIGVDSNGRNNEFELNQSIRFVVNSYLNKSTKASNERIDESLIEPIIVQARRSFYLDNIDLIGKRAEEDSLLESIRQEVSRKLISRFVVVLDKQKKQAVVES